MLKIGEFSKLSHLTVKTLRYYEKEGLLIPQYIDEITGYRYYETDQLIEAARIISYRQLNLTISEIKSIISGADVKVLLKKKSEILQFESLRINSLISTINNILEDRVLKFNVTEKIIPEVIVYYSEAVLNKYHDLMEWIPTLAKECLKLNPEIRCTEPPYEYCEYPDGEFKDTDIQVRHNEAVTFMGIENDLIKFRRVPATKVLSIFHKGAYENIGEAYAYIIKYAEENKKTVIGLARECYIDGIWNKATPDEWLTEIQLPIE